MWEFAISYRSWTVSCVRCVGFCNILKALGSELCKMCGDCDILLGAGFRAVDDVEGFVPFPKNWNWT